MMTLGQRIKIILKEQKIKQIDFARTLGISANYANLIVNDKKSTISDMDWEKFSSWFDKL